MLFQDIINELKHAKNRLDKAAEELKAFEEGEDGKWLKELRRKSRRHDLSENEEREKARMEKKEERLENSKVKWEEQEQKLQDALIEFDKEKEMQGPLLIMIESMKRKMEDLEFQVKR
ncbi:4312_t:CDS:2, partial [Funneliformis mosseae]